MKKFTSILVLTVIAMIAFTTPLLAMEKVISATEFTVKTGLTIEDVIDDDDQDIATTCAVVVEYDDYYIIIAKGEVYVVNK